MSGPKTASYQVVANAELERRALVAARARAADWQTRLRATGHSIEESAAYFGEELPSFDAFPTCDIDSATLDQALQFARAAQRSVTESETRLARELLRLREERATAAARGEVTGTAHDAADALAAHEARSRTDALHQRQQTACRILSRLREDAAPSDVAAAQDVRDAYLQEASPPRAAAFEDELRLRVGSANAAAAARAEDSAAAAALIESALGLSAAGLAPLAAELARVERGECRLTEELRTEFERVRDDARAESDREHAARVAADALASLGYVVEKDFTTLLVRRGVAHVASSKWQGYAVRLRLPPSREEMNFNVVRSDGLRLPQHGQVVRDGEVEAEWCSDFPRVMTALRARGVECAAARQVPPGTLPVQEVPAGSLEMFAHGRPERSRPASRQREVGAT